MTGIKGKASATVEAEYGSTLVEGSVLTMAHHGARAGQPAPCSYPNGCAKGVEFVGLSHVDLDSLGGCAAILGLKPENDSFWDLAEFVDLNGPHKLAESGASEKDVLRLYAFWAWSKENRVFPPRDGSVADVTNEVIAGIEAITKILSDDSDMIYDGEKFRREEEALNKASFEEFLEGVIVRSHDQFTNHLYNTPDGQAAKAVVAFNGSFDSITVSFADAPNGISACEIVQKLWGKEAGGHKGIAGSPRGQAMDMDDLEECAQAVAEALKGH